MSTATNDELIPLGVRVALETGTNIFAIQMFLIDFNQSIYSL